MDLRCHREVDRVDKVELQVKESNTLMQYVTLKAYKFPFINVLWAGTIIMVIGFFISAMNRRERKKLEKRTQMSGTLLKAESIES